MTIQRIHHVPGHSWNPLHVFQTLEWPNLVAILDDLLGMVFTDALNFRKVLLASGVQIKIFGHNCLLSKLKIVCPPCNQPAASVDPRFHRPLCPDALMVRESTSLQGTGCPR